MCACRQAGLSTYECMDHQGRLFVSWRIASHSLLLKGINAQEIIYAQEEEREYPDYEGKIKGGRTPSSRLPGIACLHMGLRGKRECPLPVTGVPLWSATRLAVSC
jgi:hypothetical protein